MNTPVCPPRLAVFLLLSLLMIRCQPDPVPPVTSPLTVSPAPTTTAPPLTATITATPTPAATSTIELTAIQPTVTEPPGVSPAQQAVIDAFVVALHEGQGMAAGGLFGPNGFVNNWLIPPILKAPNWPVADLPWLVNVLAELDTMLTIDSCQASEANVVCTGSQTSAWQRAAGLEVLAYEAIIWRFGPDGLINSLTFRPDEAAANRYASFADANFTLWLSCRQATLFTSLGRLTSLYPPDFAAEVLKTMALWQIWADRHEAAALIGFGPFADAQASVAFCYPADWTLMATDNGFLLRAPATGGDTATIAITVPPVVGLPGAYNIEAHITRALQDIEAVVPVTPAGELSVLEAVDQVVYEQAHVAESEGSVANLLVRLIGRPAGADELAAMIYVVALVPDSASATIASILDTIQLFGP